MVRKLTAWKTIAVKEATYAVAKENSRKKYLLKVTEVRPQQELSDATFSGGANHATTNFPLSF